MGRPRLSDEERENRRLAKNQRQRDQRAAIKKARDAVKAKLARLGVKKKIGPDGSHKIDFSPTPEDRLRVETMAGLGVRQDEISLLVINPATAAPLDGKTLRRCFELELSQGSVKANAKVAKSLYELATGTGGVNRSTTACIFWLKARAGWRETQHVEVDLKSGVLVAPAGVSPEDWVRSAQESNVGKKEPGKPADGVTA